MKKFYPVIVLLLFSFNTFALDKTEFEHFFNKFKEWIQTPFTGVKNRYDESVLYRDGIKALETREYHKAFKYFDKVIERNPELYEAYAFRGFSRAGLGELRKAIEDITVSIAFRSDRDDFYLARGVIKNKIFDFKNAIGDFSKCIEINKKSHSCYIERFKSKMQLGMIEEAIQDNEEALRIEPDEYLGYANRGWINFRNQEYEKSITNYIKAISLNSTVAILYLNLGEVYLVTHQFEKADLNFEKAVDLDPEILDKVREIIHWVQIDKEMEQKSPSIKSPPKITY